MKYFFSAKQHLLFRRMLAVIIGTFLSLQLYSQETIKLEQTSEYYYCFAMIKDSVIYTNTLEVERDTIPAMSWIEDMWFNYVIETLSMKGYLTVAIGPYGSLQDIEAEKVRWISDLPESTIVNKIQFNLE